MKSLLKFAGTIQTEFALSGLLDKYANAELCPGMAPVADGIEATLKEHGLKVDEVKARRKFAVSDEDMTVAAGSREAVQWVSKRGIDRDGEILIPGGAITRDFMKAPQVFVNHNYMELPVGSDVWLRKTDEGLIARTKYATTPRANDVFTLKQEGHLRTQSVGFSPVEWVSKDDTGFAKLRDKLIEAWPEFKKNADAVNRIFSKWVVFEHSDVGIPANPEALQLAVAKGFNVSPETFESLGIKGVTFGDPATKTSVKKCARCGEDHELEFQKFAAPVEGFTHFATCPKSGEPLLMKEEAAPDKPDEPSVKQVSFVRVEPFVRVAAPATVVKIPDDGRL